MSNIKKSWRSDVVDAVNDLTLDPTTHCYQKGLLAGYDKCQEEIDFSKIDLTVQLGFANGMGISMKAEIDKLRAENESLTATCQHDQEISKKFYLENVELQGVIDLVSDDYIKDLGTWKIISRLEQREKELESKLTEAKEIIEDYIWQYPYEEQDVTAKAFLANLKG